MMSRAPRRKFHTKRLLFISFLGIFCCPIMGIPTPFFSKPPRPPPRGIDSKTEGKLLATAGASSSVKPVGMHTEERHEMGRDVPLSLNQKMDVAGTSVWESPPAREPNAVPCFAIGKQTENPNLESDGHRGTPIIRQTLYPIGMHPNPWPISFDRTKQKHNFRLPPASPGSEASVTGPPAKKIRNEGNNSRLAVMATSSYNPKTCVFTYYQNPGEIRRAGSTPWENSQRADLGDSKNFHPKGNPTPSHTKYPTPLPPSTKNEPVKINGKVPQNPQHALSTSQDKKNGLESLAPHKEKEIAPVMITWTFDKDSNFEKELERLNRVLNFEKMSTRERVDRSFRRLWAIQETVAMILGRKEEDCGFQKAGFEVVASLISNRHTEAGFESALSSSMKGIQYKDYEFLLSLYDPELTYIDKKEFLLRVMHVVLESYQKFKVLGKRPRCSCRNSIEDGLDRNFFVPEVFRDIGKAKKLDDQEETWEFVTNWKSSGDRPKTTEEVWHEEVERLLGVLADFDQSEKESLKRLFKNMFRYKRINAAYEKDPKKLFDIKIRAFQLLASMILRDKGHPVERKLAFPTRHSGILNIYYRLGRAIHASYNPPGCLDNYILEPVFEEAIRRMSHNNACSG